VDFPHVTIDRAVAFLLDGLKLTPDEDAHLIKCDECRRAMVEAASKAIDERGESQGLA
jgi:hypothetical protein